MNRTPWRRRREPLDLAELAELAGLLPAPGDPVLPHGRMTTLEEHLMNEIQQAQARKAAETEPQSAGRIPSRSSGRPFRGGRRLALIGAAVAVAVLAGVAGAAQFTGQDTVEAAGSPEGSVPASVVQAGQGTTQGLSNTVALISGAAAREKLPEPKPGQFIYIKSQVSWLTESEDANGKSETYVQKLHPRQAWMSPDGRKGWLIEPGNGTTSREGLTLDVKGEALKEGPRLGAPSYDYLKKLTTDPDELLKKIYKETKGQGNGPDQQAFTTIGDLVREQVMPAQLTSALYRAAAKIPGVMVVEKTTDAVGRQGIAIARTDEYSGDRTEWIFDSKTFSYLGERTVQMRDRSGIKAGTVTGHTAITERAVVDGMKELPGSRNKI
ncbi:CU044_5270 family protein [Streptomyces sp. NPDC057136]|uniref:CU044_5270 family protein n=1 Tax=Streptomyces sp. NPDC057136 TaxID=3346029 RepID=UPI003630CBA9